MSTTTGRNHWALLISLGIAASLASCSEPPVNNTATSDDPLVPLARDPNIPLLIIAKQQADGTWLPQKVVSISNEQCPGNIPNYGGHTTCRKKSQRIRWFAQNADSYENPGPGVNFTITFKDANDDPLDGPNGAKCKTSADGALDCKIRNSAQFGGYNYTVTMNGGALDPRIYVNP